MVRSQQIREQAKPMGSSGAGLSQPSYHKLMQGGQAFILCADHSLGLVSSEA